MNKKQKYKSMNFGCITQGQSIQFKKRYSSVQDELYKKVSEFTYWIDSYTTVDAQGRNYFTIVGSFNERYKEKFNTLCEYYLKRRDFMIASNEFDISQSKMDLLDLIDEYQKSQMEEWVTESKDWTEYLTPLDAF